MIHISRVKIFLAVCTVAMALTACGSGNKDKSQTLKPPQAVEIETPPMPDNT